MQTMQKLVDNNRRDFESKAAQRQKSWANGPKHELMRVMNDLEACNLLKEADRLGAIIGELEHWQNS